MSSVFLKGTCGSDMIYVSHDIKVKAPFCDKLSGTICTKFFGRDMVYTLRVKFQDNQGVVQFRNDSNETAHLRKNKAIGILHLRSLGPNGKYG